MEWYQFYWEWIRMAFTKPLAITQAVAFVCLLIAAFLKWKNPSWEGVMSNLIWQIPSGILVLLLLAGLITAPYRIYKDKQGEVEKISGFATPDSLLGSRLEGIDFRIVDLAREDLIIKNRTIVNCRIYGPAVLYPVSSSFRNIGFSSGGPLKSLEENLASIFIPIPEASFLQGIIKVENVDFRDCSFKKISFIGTDQLKKALLNDLSNPD